jgi:hypothetical protein
MKKDKAKEVFLSYIDDSGLVVNSWFILLEENQTFVKVKSGSNVLTIPFHRINKIKERLKNE